MTETEKRREYMREYMRRKRVNSDVNKEPVNSPNVNTNVNTDSDVNRTATDALFDAAKPGYYIFDAPLKDRHCWACGKPYATRLDLNKFCSPTCKRQYLAKAFSTKAA